jgi:hypothetical protein
VSSKTFRVFADPVAGFGIEPAVEVVLEAGGFVEEAAGEAEEAIDGGIGLLGEFAEGIVAAMVGNRGDVGCRIVRREVADGHIYWKERLPGKYSGSPIAANGLVYILNEAGKTIVIKPGPTLEVIAENDLVAAPDEIFRATPTPLDGQLFIRSTTTLYCVGKK